MSSLDLIKFSSAHLVDPSCDKFPKTHEGVRQTQGG